LAGKSKRFAFAAAAIVDGEVVDQPQRALEAHARGRHAEDVAVGKATVGFG